MEDRIKNVLILTIVVIANAAVYVYALLFIAAFLGAGWNYLLVPDGCWPVETRTCNITVRFALWGGAFFEATTLSVLLYVLSKAILHSFLLRTRAATIVMIVQIIAAFCLFTVVGIFGV